MPIQQKVLALVVGLSVFLLIVELVRRRKLRENYAWLWLLTGTTVLVLAVWYDFLLLLSHLLGATVPVLTLFFFSTLFLALIALYYSVKISTLSDQVKVLAQEVALLRGRVEEEE